jgi:AcrR family transcriptional regulator
MSRSTHRHALLAAAKQLLREKGYARTTARDLVAASGTNLASIGYHFGSKEALLNEAIAESFGEWTERMDRLALADEGAGPVERLQTGMRAVMDSFDEMRPFFVACVEALAQAERNDELRAQLAHNYDMSRRQVGETVAQALGIGDDDAETIASLIIALTDGLFIQAFLDPDRTPRPDDFAAAMGRALTGIGQGPAVAP